MEAGATPFSLINRVDTQPSFSNENVNSARFIKLDKKPRENITYDDVRSKIEKNYFSPNQSIERKEIENQAPYSVVGSHQSYVIDS
jgi:hypothetical protein